MSPHCVAGWALTMMLSVSAHAEDAYQARHRELCAAHPLAAAPTQKPRAPMPVPRSQLCRDVDLYYGFDKAPDYAAARECASDDAKREAVGTLLSGDGVLAMIYANGQGVPRDIDRAEAYACKNEWLSNQGLEGVLAQLERMRGDVSGKLDLCQYADNTPSEADCASVASRWAGVRRGQRIQAYAPASAPAALKQALVRLRQAETAFADARAGDEVDMSGTGRTQFYLSEHDQLEEQVLINLRDFSTGGFPQAGAREAAAADREMAGLLAELRRRGMPAGSTTITLEGIEKTQAAWLRARAAWVDFVSVAWPALNRDRVRCRLTRQRIHQLKVLARYAQMPGG